MIWWHEFILGHEVEYRYVSGSTLVDCECGKGWAL